MSWQYLKNRDEILRKEIEEEEKVNYFIKEGFYKDVVRVALDEAVKEKLFVSYKEEVNNEDYKKIILEFPYAHEYLSEDHILEIEKDEDLVKLRLTHAESQMDVSTQEHIYIVKEFYNDIDAVGSFSVIVDELFRLLDRARDRDQL